LKTAGFIALLTATLIAASTSFAVTIDIVPIGNPGNPPDMRYPSLGYPLGRGSVGYSFRMGKTEVTNAQYVEFLNAVAADDRYQLYFPFMTSSTQSGIVRNGTFRNFTYAVKPLALGDAYAYENKPVVFVELPSAMRFANWLHNGQPHGPQGPATTEDGAYTLARVFTDFGAVPRNPGARWWLPTPDEWYKAAYFDPISDTYWDYPTGTNDPPNNRPPSGDTGNSANFFFNGYATGNLNYPLTDAGAYALSRSPYGTFDQAGNVREWNKRSGYGSVYSGGSWVDPGYWLSARQIGDDEPQLTAHIGFRVATVIPEPSTMLLGALGMVAVMWWRRRRS